MTERSVGRRLLHAARYYTANPVHLFRRLAGGRLPVGGWAAESLAGLLGPENSLICVDVGGAGDLQPHWRRMLGNARFLVYEPHLESYQALVTRQATDTQYADFRYINTALSEVGGPRSLFKTNVPTGSSLMRPKAGGASDYERNQYIHPYEELTVQTQSLKSSLDELRVSRVDMIKLDTQGSEIEILRGLDEERLGNVLLVEAELSVLDHYEGGERNLEDGLALMRRKGFSLFDLRTARFVGNALRFPPEAVHHVIGRELELPPNANRLNEVDAIFVRDPRILIEEGVDTSTLRRLIGALLVYNFFPEATYAALEGRRRTIFRASEADDILGGIKLLHAQAKIEAMDAIAAVRTADGMVWGQYMWVPYPSS